MLPKIRAVIEHLCATLDHPADLKELARIAGLSPSRLSYLFKRETGRPIWQYRKQLRLQAARDLLESTSLTIKEIRVRVGARDPSHFARDFKAAYGLPPAKFRGAARTRTRRQNEAESLRRKKNRKIGHKQ
jgi:AraC family transcriptional regulator of arabinose operon